MDSHTHTYQSVCIYYTHTHTHIHTRHRQGIHAVYTKKTDMRGIAVYIHISNNRHPS